MEEARKKLFQKAIRTFEFKNLVRHQTIGSGQNNLIELISRYPGNGQGFKVHRKTWPEGCYWQLKNITVLNGRNARLMGVKYWNGELVSKKVEQVPGVLKRGLWQYTIDPETVNNNVHLDNGNKYNIKEMHQLIQDKNEFIKGRKAAMEYKVTAEAD